MTRFLVADTAAPRPAQDYDYAEEMKVAAELGVNLPIGSRLDGPAPDQKVAEYVFRQLAQFTGELTYRDVRKRGEPGTVYDVPGAATVWKTSTLVVRLVQEGLPLAGEQQ